MATSNRHISCMKSSDVLDAAQRVGIQLPRARHNERPKTKRSRAKRSAAMPGWAAFGITVLAGVFQRVAFEKTHASGIPSHQRYSKRRYTAAIARELRVHQTQLCHQYALTARG